MVSVKLLTDMERLITNIWNTITKIIIINI